MTLGDLISALERIPPATIIRHGFGTADSYRGSYEHLAFAPARNVTAESMLVHARSALGRTFNGYKGGEFVMDEFTECYIAEYGCLGGAISETLVAYWAEETRS